jgi:hypothetical protein
LFITSPSLNENRTLNPQRKNHNNATRITLATTLVAACAALSACGGGGSDSSATSTYDATAFVGTWTAVSTAACTPGFAYNAAYASKPSSVTITSTTLAITQIIYTDATCATKAGKLVESYNVVTSEGVVSGWSNEARMAATVMGISTGADGGAGLSLTKVPDGTATMSGNAGKFLWAVNGASLYAGNYTATKDSAGYPQVILSAASYTK